MIQYDMHDPPFVTDGIGCQLMFCTRPAYSNLSSVMQALWVAPNPDINVLRVPPGSFHCWPQPCHVMSCHTMRKTVTTRSCQTTSRHTCLLMFMPNMFMPSMPEVVTGLVLGARVLGVACCRRAQEGDSGLALRHSTTPRDTAGGSQITSAHSTNALSSQHNAKPLLHNKRVLAQVVKPQSRFFCCLQQQKQHVLQCMGLYPPATTCRVVYLGLVGPSQRTCKHTLSQ